jgi:CubicO group peptidase (beta-lactamase class C family)
MLENFFSFEIKRGTFPSVSYLIAKSDKVLKKGTLGYSVLKPEKIKANVNTIYDLASLTKPLVTACLFGLFFQEKILNPRDKLGKFFSNLTADKKSISLIDLLTHQSGFPDWYPLYLEGRDKEEILDFLLLKLNLQYKPGTKVIYSCLGYIILGNILEKITGKSLDYLAKKHLFEPLNLKNTFFNPPSHLKSNISATEKGNLYEKKKCREKARNYFGWRNGIIWGEVHDQNCYALGGFAGNSGLFSNINDLHILSLQFLKESSLLFKPQIINYFYTNYTSYSYEHRTIGWKLASSSTSSAGNNFSVNSIGHTGFTGTSIWIIPNVQAIFILLTNRIHPEYKEMDFDQIRRKFHDLAWLQFFS